MFGFKWEKVVLYKVSRDSDGKTAVLTAPSFKKLQEESKESWNVVGKMHALHISYKGESVYLPILEVVG